MSSYKLIMSCYCLMISVQDTNELFNVSEITKLFKLFSTLSALKHSFSISFGSVGSSKYSCSFIKDAKCMLIYFYNLRSLSTIEF